MRIMVIGDTHMNDVFIDQCFFYAEGADIDVMIQVGDFGFNFDSRFIGAITAGLDRNPHIQFFWLDGNHDDHDYIRNRIMSKGAEQVDWRHPVPHWHERMFYCPRGSTHWFAGKRVMFMGGAYSIDQHRRTPGVSWWYGEMITEMELQRAMSMGKVDVLFSHDSPQNDYLDYATDGFKNDRSSVSNRRKLSVLLESAQPDDVYHGHYHEEYECDVELDNGKQVHVHGIGADSRWTPKKSIPVPPTWGQNLIMLEW